MTLESTSIPSLSVPIDERIAQFLPARYIHSFRDMDRFKASPSYAKLISFITQVNNSIFKLGDNNFPDLDRPAAAVMEILKHTQKILDETPPTDAPHRYANPSYRVFHARLRENIYNIVKPLRELGMAPEIVGDVAGYFLDSFGNGTRGDYGTGHEAHWVTLLACVHIALRGDTGEARDFLQAWRPFEAYTSLVMTMQQRYTVEPAGPKGGWAVDLFRLIPYYWGSARLEATHVAYPHPPADSLYSRSMLFSPTPTGTGVVSECLNNIHDHCTSWTQINRGVARMYRGEVTDSFVVMQHFLFGKTFPWAISSRDTKK